jgi:branched-chain amino acid transport system permease protein
LTDPSLFGVDLVTFFTPVMAYFGLYLAISLSLNLESGYTGIPNFGKVLYFAGGSAFSGWVALHVAAYAVGVKGNPMGTGNFLIANQITSTLQANPAESALLALLAVGVGALAGGLLGLASILPAIRLREDYLAMLLLGSAQFFQILLENYSPIINGNLGIGLPNFFAWAGTSGQLPATLVLVAFGLLVYVYAERTVRSPLGRTMRALRDSEAASEALGKDSVAIRRNTLIVASMITGMAGALYSLYTADANPLVFNRVDWTFWPWLIVILGGAANNFGVSVGSFVFVFLLQAINTFKYNLQAYLPFDVNWLQYLIFGSLLILILMLKPDGIFPEKPSATLGEARSAAIVESSTKGEPPPEGEGEDEA